jgi:hypothetical protein
LFDEDGGASGKFVRFSTALGGSAALAGALRKEANVFTAFGAVADTEGVGANGIEGEENAGVEFDV